MKVSYSTFVILISMFLGGSVLAQTPGTFNTNFGSNGYQFYDEFSKDQFGRAVATQPDGKVLVGGMHEHTNGKYDWLVYRLNANGTPDNSFSGDGKYTNSFSDEDYLVSIGLQSNGKILLAGYSNLGNGNWDIIVHRLNANGTLDNTFGNSGTVQLDRSIGAADALSRMVITPDDKIYLGGFMQILGETYFLVYRLLADGTPDSTFSLDGNVFYDTDTEAIVADMAISDNGEVAMAGYVDDNGVKMMVVKFTNSGDLDNSFSGDGVKIFSPGLNKEGGLLGITFLPNGKMVGVGQLLGNDDDAIILQLTSTGILDGSFNGNGMLTYDLSIGGDDSFEQIERLANGGYLVLAKTKTNFTKGSLYQLNSDGSIDATNYGSGSGKLGISISNDNEFVNAMAINNNHVFTVGNFENGQHDDIFVTSSHLYNPVSVTEYQLNSNAVKFFPNPASKDQPITVLLDDEISGRVNMSIYTINGQQVYSADFYKVSSEYNHQVKIPQVPAGVYLLKIENEGKSITQKLIIH